MPDINEEFLNAIKRNDANTVENLLKNNPVVTDKTSTAAYVLQFVAAGGVSKNIIYLDNVTQENRNYPGDREKMEGGAITPLFEALRINATTKEAEKSQKAIIDLLLEKGVDPRKGDVGYANTVDLLEKHKLKNKDPFKGYRDYQGELDPQDMSPTDRTKYNELVKENPAVVKILEGNREAGTGVTNNIASKKRTRDIRLDDGTGTKSFGKRTKSHNTGTGTLSY